MTPTSLKVLLVEDDRDIRELLSEELEDSGFDVDTTMDGQEALQRLHGAAELPDVILSNYNMPGMDGLALVHEIRGDAQLPDLPIVLMTAGLASDGDLSDADAVIHKPLEVDEVIEVLERVHRRHRIRELPLKAAPHGLDSHV